MKISLRSRLFWLLLLLSLVPFRALGQETATKENPALTKKSEVTDDVVTANEVVTLRHASKLMSREMPYRVILPFGYKNPKESGKSYPVVYLLHGLTGHYDNWTDKTKLAEYAKKYNYLIVMPEGGDGWYTDSATVPEDKWESYLIQELIPEIDSRFRTLADRNRRVIAGLSMGGYGSLKFGLKYPDKFVLVGSFSGALGAASWTEKTIGTNWKALTDSIKSIYGAEDSRTRQENDIYKTVRELTPEKAKLLPFIYLDCGTEDFLIGQNRDFNALLLEKKIPHEFRLLPGRHDWNFWNAQVREFLELSEKYVK